MTDKKNNKQTTSSTTVATTTKLPGVKNGQVISSSPKLRREDSQTFKIKKSN